MSRGAAAEDDAHQPRQRCDARVAALGDVIVDEDRAQPLGVVVGKLGAQREHHRSLARPPWHHAHAGDAHAAGGEKAADLRLVRVARDDEGLELRGERRQLGVERVPPLQRRASALGGAQCPIKVEEQGGAVPALVGALPPLPEQLTAQRSDCLASDRVKGAGWG